MRGLTTGIHHFRNSLDFPRQFVKWARAIRDVFWKVWFTVSIWRKSNRADDGLSRIIGPETFEVIKCALNLWAIVSRIWCTCSTIGSFSIDRLLDQFFGLANCLYLKYRYLNNVSPFVGKLGHSLNAWSSTSISILFRVLLLSQTMRHPESLWAVRYLKCIVRKKRAELC